MLRYTLIGDGSSDKTLLKIIKWSLSNLLPTVPLAGEFADFRGLPKPPKQLEDKVKKAIELYPCDILFIHRDGESIKDVEKVIQKRQNEIREACLDLSSQWVAVVTVKMMEAWLLTDALAIMRAAGNPSARTTPMLPKITNLEFEQAPKELLHHLLKTASGSRGRRLQSFNVNQAVHLVAEYTTDFAKLRQLTAFAVFERDLVLALNQLGYIL